MYTGNRNTASQASIFWPFAGKYNLLVPRFSYTIFTARRLTAVYATVGTSRRPAVCLSFRHIPGPYA